MRNSTRSGCLLEEKHLKAFVQMQPHSTPPFPKSRTCVTVETNIVEIRPQIFKALSNVGTERLEIWSLMSELAKSSHVHRLAICPDK